MQHIFARDDVFAVVVGDEQVFVDEFRRFDCFFSRISGSGATDIRFHRMRKCVHARSGGNLRGQTESDGRVQHGVLRDKAKVVYRIFVVSFVVGYYCGKRYFATRACRCGDCDKERKFLSDT